MMKKGGIGFIFVLISALLVFVSFASAYYLPDLRYVSQRTIDYYVDFFEPILQALFGGYGGWSGLYLFERFLLFILLVSMIYVILGKVDLFEHNSSVKWAVAIIVPLIGMRFIDYGWFSAVLMQYGTLSIALSSVLPFILFFFFVHNIGKDYPLMRKILWIAFICIYAGLWSTAESEFSSAMFFWTMLASILMLIFDTKIELYLGAREFAKRERRNVDNEIARINMRINEIETQIRTGAHPNPNEARREINELRLQKKYLARNRII